jgi:2-(1,2-epoxy-1,2-dihydrophenyl)acetyl-CoA isomerase
METLLIHDQDGVRTITLNRPESLNAVTERMTAELAAALKDAGRDRSVRCLVLTGAGRAFCVGQDVKSLRQQADAGVPMDFAAALRQRYNPVVSRLYGLEIPTVAGLNGVAAGAGWSLALACDLRVAADTATFVSAFTKIGLLPDSGMTQTLPRLVGMARALEVAWLSDPIPAAQALAWGLVNQVVPADQVAAATATLAARLAQSATRGLAMTKRAFRASFDHTLEEQLEYEAQLQGAAGQTSDHREGVQAFLNKRAPQFTGE